VWFGLTEFEREGLAGCISIERFSRAVIARDHESCRSGIIISTKAPAMRLKESGQRLGVDLDGELYIGLEGKGGTSKRRIVTKVLRPLMPSHILSPSTMATW